MSKQRDKIRSLIEREVFSRHDPGTSTGEETRLEPNGWIFDFRKITMQASVLDTLGELFWESTKEAYPFQIGTLETAGIPLMSSFVHKLYHEKNKGDASGFFIRKSRKKDGLARMVEGTLVPNRPVVLVDDLLNSGKTMMRQVKILEELGYEVAAIWVIIRFQDMSHYKYFTEKGIRVLSLFTLNDFEASLGVSNISEERDVEFPDIPFVPKWRFESGEPNYHLVAPKSDPVIDSSKVYIGSDRGVFWAINQSDGSIAWSRKVGFHISRKGILSSPAIWGKLVFFGAYDGNVYALDTETGRPKWIHFGGDWVGSSPALAPDLDTLFIGLEFGLIRKRGGIVAIDMSTGKRIWKYENMPCYTHSSPLYIQKHKQVVIGSNDGAAYLFNAKTGELVWKFETGTPTPKELTAGFSDLDIKESFAYDEERDVLVFGTMAGSLFIVNRKTGEKVHEFKAEFGFTSTPCIYKGRVYATSLDKNLYCIDLNSGEELWRWNASARIFASPIIIENSLYIGANTGRLTELDPETGKELSFAMVTERITNRPAYNPKTKRFFVPTYANELYCMERRNEKK